MNLDDDLVNAFRRENERQLSGRYNTRTGLVTSYDSKTHSAKVMIKPDDFETGWEPIHTGLIGNGWGILAGLTPGDGKKTGDQVELTFTEGDLEQGRIINRLHSDKDRPPKVESGEILVMNAAGHYIFFDKDKNLTVYHNAGDPPKGGDAPQTGNGTYIKVDKDGKLAVFSNKNELKLDDGNGATHTHDGNGKITRTAKTINDSSTSGDHTRTASANITDTAQTLIHNGLTTVAGQLNVSQLLSANGGLAGTGGLNMTGGASVIGGLTADKISATLGNFANDAAAAAGGVSIGQLYRNASAVLVRSV